MIFNSEKGEEMVLLGNGPVVKLERSKLGGESVSSDDDLLLGNFCFGFDIVV